MDSGMTKLVGRCRFELQRCGVRMSSLLRSFTPSSEEQTRTTPLFHSPRARGRGGPPSLSGDGRTGARKTGATRGVDNFSLTVYPPYRLSGEGKEMVPETPPPSVMMWRCSGFELGCLGRGSRARGRCVAGCGSETREAAFLPTFISWDRDAEQVPLRRHAREGIDLWCRARAVELAQQSRPRNFYDVCF
jgi:hypothetical protein